MNVISHYKFTLCFYTDRHASSISCCVKGQHSEAENIAAGARCWFCSPPAAGIPWQGFVSPAALGHPPFPQARRKHSYCLPAFIAFLPVFFLPCFFFSRGFQGGRVNLRSSKWLKGKIIKALVRCRHMTPVRRLYA